MRVPRDGKETSSIVPWLAWAWLLVSPASQAGVHRCLQKDGSTEYTDQPCPADSVPLPNHEPSRVVVEQKGKVTNLTVVGQLAAKQPLSCVSIDLAGKDHTPPDLYQGVSACIQQEDYRTAVALFALAGMESRFDAQRVLDKTAGQAGQALIMDTINGIPDDRRRKFQAAVKSVAEDPEVLSRTCASVRKIGYPTYYPAYMVLHGIRAFTAKPDDPTLEPNFDGATAWNSLLGSYLNCR
ncbi:MAG TPA: DUF4124 domain-containing protein [Steroidobacteraceae bacterium]|nr:DUF4124 domain-containing protein [Steroidobacteraceae bacterium]